MAWGTLQTQLAAFGGILAILGSVAAVVTKFNGLENRVGNLEQRVAELAEASPAGAPQGLSGRERQCWDIVYRMTLAARAKDDAAINRLTMMSGKFGCGFAATQEDRRRTDEEQAISNTTQATM